VNVVPHGTARKETQEENMGSPPSKIEIVPFWATGEEIDAVSQSKVNS